MIVSRAAQGNWDLWLLDGVRTSRFTFDSALDRQPVWSPDGKRIVFRSTFREIYGAFSPDGRWVAYQSNESGRSEIYVRPFVAPGSASPATGAQWLVSTTGGMSPVWRPDGKELYYLNPAGLMMAAPITAAGSTLEPGTPVALFPTHMLGGGQDGGQGRQDDVAPDDRFSINTELDSASVPITLILNWQPPAKK